MNTPRVPSNSCADILYLKINEFSPTFDLVFKTSSKELFFALFPISISPSGELSLRKMIGSLA
jgi:hypothetical protein